jgi:hypothetical protein
MPDLILFVPCEKAVVDTFSNELSLFGVMDEVRPLIDHEEEPSRNEKEPPFTLAPFFVVTLWRRKPNEEALSVEQIVEMAAPDGRTVQLFPPITVQLTSRNNRIVQGTPVITVRLMGEYRLRLKCRFGNEEWQEDYAHYSFMLGKFPSQPASKPKEATEQPALSME